MSTVSKADILKDLQSDILRLQGFKSLSNVGLDMGLGPIIDAFPNSRLQKLPRLMHSRWRQC